MGDEMRIFRYIYWGLYYKYPLCCILQFVKEGWKFPGELRRIRWGDYKTPIMGYVPCDRCIQKGSKL